MALPQQVIDKLTLEPSATPGWSVSLLLFTGGIFVFTLLIYVGLAYGYEPYINGQITQLQGQVTTIAQSISSADQANLVTFYSEITNVKSTLANHVIFSNFLSWLQTNTEANIFYPQMSFSGGTQVTLSGFAKNESDVNQQLAIFESSPAVKSVTISGIALQNTSGLWQFTAILTMISQTVFRANF